VNAIVAAAALLVFAWLATRHVGESVFLEDQVDQLQNFESLLRLEPEGLWGGIMSDTRPPARALGPSGAIVFGVPVALGLGIDSIHFITSLLISIGAAAVFMVLTRIDSAFAWLWFLVFSATGIVWWNAGLLWTNTLLLPAGLAIMALSASSLSRPRVTTLAFLLCAAAVALQLHLVAIVSVPVVLVVMAVTGRKAWTHPPGRGVLAFIAIVAIAAVLPYVLAESLTGFQNTRAILSHADVMGRGARERGVAGAVATLSIAADPSRAMDQFGIGAGPVIAFGAVVTVAALILYGVRLRRRLAVPPEDRRANGVIFWLIVAAVAGTLGQALFFVWTARELAGLHYVTLLTPFYAVAPAALLRAAVSRSLSSYRIPFVLGGVCLAFLLWAGPSLADRFLPPTQWSYQRITFALDALCAGVGVDTDEGQGLAAQLNPKYDSVLRYLMKRRFSACRYEPGSAVLIVATREEKFDEWHAVRDTRYRLEAVQPPGIARYRRWP
jgi:hypothetical protein